MCTDSCDLHTELMKRDELRADWDQSLFTSEVSSTQHEGSNFRAKDVRRSDGGRERVETMEKGDEQVRAQFWKRPIKMHYGTASPHTHTFSAGVVCCRFNCPPLTSANGFHDIATMSLHNEASYGWTGASSVSQLQINRHRSYFYLCIKAETVFTLCQLELRLSLRKSI